MDKKYITYLNRDSIKLTIKTSFNEHSGNQDTNFEKGQFNITLKTIIVGQTGNQTILRLPDPINITLKTSIDEQTGNRTMQLLDIRGGHAFKTCDLMEDEIKKRYNELKKTISELEQNRRTKRNPSYHKKNRAKGFC